jgi:effector-binding domain-containing protein
MTETGTGEGSIVTVERRYAAVIKALVPMAGIPDAQRSSRSKVAEVLPSLGVGPAGPHLTIWQRPVDGALPMEMGVFVSGDFAAKDGVISTATPAGKAAHMRLDGPFDLLPGAWQTLFDWAHEQQLPLANINWEIYGSDPERPSTDLYMLLS